MPTTLVVLAHPEHRSFNGAWAAETVQISKGLEHEVAVSDLCQMGFDPVEHGGHFDGSREPFDPSKAQESAAEAGTLPDDVVNEIEKIKQADRIILHFPLWWFGPPAILKGWCDRVLAHGALHSVERRFDAGLCRGKKVLFCVTTGADEAEVAHNGKEGDIQMLLWPLAYTFRYLGMTVLEPSLVHGVHGYFEGAEEDALKTRLRIALKGHKEALAEFDHRSEISFNADTDFDETGRLKPHAPSYSHFIRHIP